ncbi:BON domain-containing protein [Deinococcus oregonensis]|uniref:BON domain-containing protein n=1 Tax=Deinococcus oregonensis TaxID=1805970 RepID=A0ABV6B0J3_9DEIO
MWPFGKNTADRVKDALNENPVTKSLGIDVQEHGGNVSLKGEVSRQSLVGLVTSIVQGINGVKTIDTGGITVLAPASAPAQVAPSASADIQMPKISTQDNVSNAQQKAEDAEIEDNSRIAKAVYSALKNNGELKDDPIDVLQSGKSIILRGVVDNDHEQRLAEQLARAVQGVASVDVSGLKVAAGAKELVKEKDTDTGDTVYTVQPGDTLGEIAQKYYGNAGEYKKIAHYNNISNPDLIKVGQKLRIPS